MKGKKPRRKKGWSSRGKLRRKGDGRMGGGMGLVDRTRGDVSHSIFASV